jgi:hypothetical protein
MHTRLTVNGVLKDFLSKGASQMTETKPFYLVEHEYKNINKEKLPYFINTWVLLMLPFTRVWLPKLI